MKVGTDGSHRAPAAFLLFLLLPFFLILAACPPVVTDTIATQATDKLPPTITVTSPATGSTYLANVTVTGTITDDAVKSGDGLGTVRTIDYSVANNVLLKGKISIADDGTATQVASFGSGTITWTKSTSTFTFTVSTVSPTVLTGAMTIMVDAADANGNESTSTLQLSQNPGPVIALSSPSGTNLKYTAGTTALTVSGTVANSSDDLKNDDNISSITWGVTGKNWGATINVVSGTTSYSVVNTGLIPTSNFTFNTTTRTFSTTFTMPFINDQSLILTVAATDKNGHTTSLITYLVADVSGPQMSLSSATSGLYYSPSFFTAPTVTGNVDVSTLQTMTFQLTTSGGYDSGAITVFPIASNGTGYTGSLYYFDTVSTSPTYGNFSFVMRSASKPNLLSTANGTVTVTINAAGPKATTTAQYTIAEDITAPTVTVGSISTSNGNATHTKVGDKITLTFNASDSQSGLNGYPVVTIAGQPATVAAPVGNTYTATYTLQTSDSAYDNLAIPYRIVATDVAGNFTDTGIVASSILFYESTPTLSPVSIASDNSTTNLARNGNKVTLSFSSSRILVAAPAVTIATQSVTASTVSTSAPYLYTAEYTYPTLDNTDTEGIVPFTIDFTDAAGNAGSQVTAITTGSNVTYDRTAPTGYSVTLGQTQYNTGATTMSFTLNNGEAGSTYYYTVSTSADSTTKTGNATITGTDNHPGSNVATTSVTGIDISGVTDGTITLTVYLKDTAGNQGGNVTASTVIKDTTAPSGYTVTLGQTKYYTGATTMSFTLNNGEAGSTYYYTVSTSADSTTKTGNAVITGTDNHPGSNVATTNVTGIDISGVTDGTITLTVYLKDTFLNQGANRTASTVIKDTTAPSGYSVSFGSTLYNSTTSSSLGFTITNGEAGSTYYYTVSTSADSTTKTGNATITGTDNHPGSNVATTNVTGIDISGVTDGTITLTVYLKDTYGNQGGNQSNSTTTVKDTSAPTGYSVTLGQTQYNTGATTMSFTLNNGEAGSTYYYTVSTSADSTTKTGNATITGTDNHPGSNVATTSVTGIDISGVTDGTITLTVYLKDTAGNQGGNVTAGTVIKDTTAPSGYTVTLGQTKYYTGATTMSFTLNNGEAGSTYYYTVSTSADSTTKTGNAVITGTDNHPGSNVATTNVTGIDISGVTDGTITLTVYLKDTFLNQGANRTASTVIKDTTAPSGYSVSFGSTLYNSTTSSSLGFTITNGEAGSTYYYTVSTSADSTTKTGNATITGTDNHPGSNVATTNVTGIDISGVTDGTITLTVYLKDTYGNQGGNQSNSTTTVKDTSAPTGYSVTLGQTQYNTGATTMSFTLNNGEAGSTYYYTVSTSADSTTKTGNATITGTDNHPGSNVATTSVTGIDISGVTDGTITLTVYLKDTAGNQGGNVTAGTVIKDTTAPSGYTVTLGQTKYYTGATTMSFTLNNGEAGSTYYYTVSTSADSTTKTGNAVITGTDNHPGSNVATTNVTGIDISGVTDGTITLTVYLKDTFLNQGANRTASTVIKDTTAPSGYSVTLGQTQYSSGATTMSFTLNNGEAGSTYYYAVSTSADSTTKTGNAVITGTDNHPGSNVATTSVTGIDISGVTDGTITLTVYLKDTYLNQGGNVTAGTVIKDTAAPSGYSVTLGQTHYNSGATTMSFTLNNGEAGSTYYYTVSTSADSTTKTGNATITGTDNHPGSNVATTSVTGIDISGVTDGTITLTVYLKDTFLNQGGNVTAGTVIKDATVPSGYTTSISSAYINNTTKTALGFTISNAEAGTDYYYTISTSADSTTKSGNATITGTAGHPGSNVATTNVSNVDVSGVTDGTLTLTVYLVDAFGNQGGNQTYASTIKDTVAPTISSAVMKDSANNEADVTYSEAVYGDSAHSQALAQGSLTITDTTHTSDVATITGITHTAGATLAKYAVSWSTNPTTGDALTMTVAASSVYDVAGNVMPSGASATSLTAKLLAAFGIQTTPASTSARPATFIGRAVNLVQSTLFGTVADGSSASTIAGQTSAASLTPVSLSTVSTVHDQFRTAIPATGQTVVTGSEAARATQGAATSANASPAVAAPPSTSASTVPTAIATASASATGTTAPTSLFTQPTVTPIVSHQAAPESLLPSWWAILIGALAIVLVTVGMWKGLKFVRGKGQK